jgi:hypothetical protein
MKSESLGAESVTLDSPSGKAFFARPFAIGRASPIARVWHDLPIWLALRCAQQTAQSLC